MAEWRSVMKPMRNAITTAFKHLSSYTKNTRLYTDMCINVLLLLAYPEIVTKNTVVHVRVYNRVFSAICEQHQQVNLKRLPSEGQRIHKYRSIAS